MQGEAEGTRRPLDVRRWTAALLTVLLALLWAQTAQPALADSPLVASDPQPHAELDRAPGWVNLAFDYPVDAGVARILVLDGDGGSATTGSLIVESNTVTVQLRDGLAPGTYTVEYRVNGDAGEPVGGSYQFAYGQAGAWRPGAEKTWAGPDNEPTVLRTSNPDNPMASPSTREPEATAEPTDSATPTASASPTPGASDTASAPSGPGTSESAPGQPADTGPVAWVVWVIGAAVAVALVAGIALAVRHARGRRP